MANIKVPKGHWCSKSGTLYRLIDAKVGMVIHVLPEDVVTAIRGDPDECAIAHASCRIAGAGEARVGSDKTYIPTILAGGEVAALRFKNSAHVKRVVDHFDETGEFPAEGIMLMPIPKSERLESQRSLDKRRRQRWGTVGNPNAKPRKKLHLRDASTRAKGVHKFYVTS